jgi:hypothetical protein
MREKQLRRLGLAVLIAAVVGLAVVGAAGAGAASAVGVKTAASDPPDPQSAILRYVKCMRAHGVNLPDPGPNGLIRINERGNGRQTPLMQTPQFAKAQKACAKYAPRSQLTPQRRQEMQEAFLKFAQCMRSNGVPNFPDPKFDGRGGVLIGGPGLNRNSPALRKAQQTCQKLLPAPKTP